MAFFYFILPPFRLSTASFFPTYGTSRRHVQFSQTLSAVRRIERVCLPPAAIFPSSLTPNTTPWNNSFPFQWWIVCFRAHHFKSPRQKASASPPLPPKSLHGVRGRACQESSNDSQRVQRGCAAKTLSARFQCAISTCHCGLVVKWSGSITSSFWAISLSHLLDSRCHDEMNGLRE